MTCSCECHKTFKRNDRVAAYDWAGHLVGRGRVMWVQPPEFYGPYMKVQLDDGTTTIVPEHTSKKLMPRNP